VNIANLFSRLTTYCRRHGLRSAVGRAALAVNRAMFSNHMELFYFDLVGEIPGPAELPSCVKLERKKDETEIRESDLQEFLSLWNPKIVRQEMMVRFRLGGALWLLKINGKVAGYGWTLLGRTIKPHFFHLGQDDVHLFDYYVAPSFRGQGLNPLLVNTILRKLAAEGARRAFIEVAEWNHAQLSSLRKTPFSRLGRASKLTIGNRTIVCWDQSRTQSYETQPTKVTTG
jgi:ribosomal protein S18 acetylase RimI-like enzyme